MAKAKAKKKARTARTAKATGQRKAEEPLAGARRSDTALVVVESPAKARTINKYLGPNFVVKASLGHIKDLPKRTLGVNLEKDFEPVYEVIPTKQKVVQELKQAARQAAAIYLAADPDREGEAICAHLAEELGNHRPVHRVLFNEITQKGIEQAFRNPTQIDQRLVAAQQARRILDRLVGYQISPLLWDRVRRGLSAGRVQSVALRVVVEREREIRAFQKKEYWTIGAHLQAKKPPVFDARLVKRITGVGEDGRLQLTDLEIPNEEQARVLEEALSAEPFVVHSVSRREKRRNPVPPFITAKLQQEAARKLRFSAKRTMMLAQRLYEGVELGPEGSVGLITYMRTDSTRVSADALAEAREFVRTDYGAAYLPAEPVVYKTKKDAQDAHEAIRPTSVLRTPELVAKYLGEDELKLYRLIWQRFVSSQMNPALFDHTAIDVRVGDFLFRATGSVLKFDGFRRVYEEGKDVKDEEDEELRHKLPPVSQGGSAEGAEDHPGAALHRAAAALQRSHPGQGTGGEGHWAAVHLRHHPQHHPGPRIRREAPEQIFTYRAGHGGERLVGGAFRRHFRRGLHRTHGKGVGRDRGGQAGLAGGAARLLRKVRKRSGARRA